MLELAVRLNWDLASAKYGASRESKALADILKEMAANSSICIVEENDGVDLPVGVFAMGTKEEGNDKKLKKKIREGD